MRGTTLEPIPPADKNFDAGSYHSILIDQSDPRRTESLVDIGASGIAVLPYYYVSDRSNVPYRQRIDGSLAKMWCRESLLPMLQSANKSLEAFQCELIVYDAYRPVATQKGIWAWALNKIATDNPNLSLSKLEAITRQYCSDPRRFNPRDATTWPTHSTGASIDVMLRSLETGERLNMGTAFDDLSSAAETDHLELELGGGRILQNNAALVNRRILYWAMTDVGFVNYPKEYWHFDFGNQMYVVNTSTKNADLDRAWYGYCEPPV